MFLRLLCASLVFASVACGDPEETKRRSRPGKGGTTAHECTDGVRDADEVCDGDDVGPATCASLGLGTGTLGCTADCQSFITTGCSGVVQDGCGNNIAEGDEVCDGTDLKGLSCTTLSLGTGTLACASCLSFDTSGCENGCQPLCGARECGLDPECGTSCGSCDDGDACQNGLCVPDDLCIPDCGLRECGLDPVCGTLDCGTCEEGSCNLAGECISSCTPNCATRECGPDPECGLSCGTCEEGSCNASGMCSNPTADALEVEVTWSGTSSHPDLWITLNNATPCDTTGTCSWNNCLGPSYPNWDPTGSAGDPRLTGYSNQMSSSPMGGIIEDPIDGNYGISVHYWDEAAGTDPDISVTVKIYVYGVLKGTYTRTMDRLAMWTVAAVSFDGTTGIVIPLQTYQLSWDCQAPADSCDSDSDCASTEYCAIGSDGNSCASGCRNDASCPSNQFCTSAHQCSTTPTVGWEEACGGGLECESGLMCSILSNTCSEYCFAPGTECEVAGDFLCCGNSGAQYCKDSGFGLPIGYCSLTP